MSKYTFTVQFIVHTCFTVHSTHELSKTTHVLYVSQLKGQTHRYFTVNVQRYFTVNVQRYFTVHVQRYFAVHVQRYCTVRV